MRLSDIYLQNMEILSMSIQARGSIESPKQLAIIEIDTTATAAQKEESYYQA